MKHLYDENHGISKRISKIAREHKQRREAVRTGVTILVHA